MAKNSSRSSAAMNAAPRARSGAPMDVRAKPPRDFGWIAPAALILVAGTLAFANSFKGAFVFDDHGHIVTSELIRELVPISTWLTKNARPVVTFTLAVNYAIGKLDTFGYHLVNLAIHLAAALVLFGIIRRTLTREPLASKFLKSGAWLAGVVAILWVVHPLQTQSVTYVIQRCESLMGLFFLLTLYCFIRGAERRPTHRSAESASAESRSRRASAAAEPPQGRANAWAWYIASVLFCALGTGSKGVTVAAPFVVMLYDRIFICQPALEMLRRRWVYYAGLFIAVASVTQAVGQFNSVLNPNPGYAVSVGFGMNTISSWEYLRTQPEVILHYLRLCFWPHPLCLDYEWQVATTGYWLNGSIILAMLIITGFLLGERPRIGFLAAVFFLILAPSSSFIPVKDLAMEHRMYLPLAAVITLVVFAAHRLLTIAAPQGSPLPAQLRALSAVFIVTTASALAWGTYQRNKSYYSSDAVWRDVTQHFPRNPRAWNNLGEGISAASQKAAAAAAEATSNSARAQSVGNKPEAERWAREAQVQQAEYKKKLAEAADAFAQAIRVKPDLPDAHYNLGKAYYELGRFPKAITHYETAKLLAPWDLPAFIMLGNLYVDQGKLSDAEREFRLAVAAVRPETDRTLTARAYYNLGNTLARQNRIPEAMEEYRRSIAAHPKYPNGYYGLGWALQQLQRYQEALDALTTALNLNPDYAEARKVYNEVVAAMRTPPAARPG